MDSNLLRERSKNLSYEVTSILKCEDEPIASCGAMQKDGYLMVVDESSRTIRALSRNFEDLLAGTKAETLLGKPFQDVVEIELESGMSSTDLCALVDAGRATIRLKEFNQTQLHGSCHEHSRNFIFEFEIVEKQQHGYPVSKIKDLVHDLRNRESIREACQIAAASIQSISGFDRVMIYRFDQAWNGEVIAEAAPQKLEPFLGLRYPASDIPPQARELFFKNRSRMIVDVEAPASPIITSGFHPAEVDLSRTLLRAVSPIHLQYLSNMGVRSSFSAPIRVQDKLWGLIACHHYSEPCHPSHEKRAAFELASQIIAGKMNDLTARRRLQIKNETLVFTQTLLGQIASGADPVQSFTSHYEQLLKLTGASAAYIRFGNREAILGKAPTIETIEKVNAKLKSVESLSIWVSNSLVKDVGMESDPLAGGALAVPFSLGFEDALIWFRPEEEQEVRWGGKPKAYEEITIGTIDRLMPRESFKEWREKLLHHSRAWTESDEECAQFFLFGFVQGIFAKAQALSQAYQELERVAKAKDEFISTVSHELRTPLGIIMGWIEILKEYPQPHAEARDAVEIIERNAKTQIGLINDLLDASRIIAGKLRLDPRPKIDINAIVADVVSSLKPTANAKDIWLALSAPDDIEMTVDPDRLRQMVWNLVTNALKFTKKGGRVSVQVRKVNSSIEISVDDTGIGIDSVNLKTIFDRFAQAGANDAKLGGLGLGLSIVRALAELHGGRVVAESEGLGKGSRFKIVLPIASFEMKEDEPEYKPTVELKKSTKLQDLHVLIAEDQPDSLRALQIFIDRNGAKSVAVSDGRQALAALKSDRFDLILSDIGMPEMDGYELLRTWREEEKKFNIRPIPAVALTAYASSKDRTKALAAGFQSHIPKPVDRDELLAVIESIGITPRA